MNELFFFFQSNIVWNDHFNYILCHSFFFLFIQLCLKLIAYVVIALIQIMLCLSKFRALFFLITNNSLFRTRNCVRLIKLESCFLSLRLKVLVWVWITNNLISKWKRKSSIIFSYQVENVYFVLWVPRDHKLPYCLVSCFMNLESPINTISFRPFALNLV